MGIFKRKSKNLNNAPDFIKREDTQLFDTGKREWNTENRDYYEYGYPSSWDMNYHYNYWYTEKGLGWELRNGYSRSSRIEAAEKLSKMNTVEALDELLEAVHEKDEKVKAAIFDAIEKIGKLKAANRLIEKTVGKINKGEKVTKLIMVLKEGREDEKENILLALKFDDTLRNEVAMQTDATLAKALWQYGESAFSLIEEVAKDEGKKRILIDSLSASSRSTIMTALKEGNGIVKDIALQIVREKGDLSYLPVLIDDVVKERNWQEAYKTIIAIEKKAGFKVSNNLESAVKDSVLFIASEEVGKSFARALQMEENKVELVSSFSKSEIEKKLRQCGVVVIVENEKGFGKNLIPFLEEKKAVVIYMSADKKDYKNLDCTTISFPPQLEELQNAIKNAMASVGQKV